MNPNTTNMNLNYCYVVIAKKNIWFQVILNLELIIRLAAVGIRLTRQIRFMISL